jgi:hypothetical protein
MDIDFSVYKKSSAETMAGKLKEMSTPQKEVAISFFEEILCIFKYYDDFPWLISLS